MYIYYRLSLKIKTINRTGKVKKARRRRGGAGKKMKGKKRKDEQR